jgi:dihydroneopterin aldolase/2-amino-4-hydroxy-6-hydroxymethyldihydropteridine diphosphokinase/dihydropteroate synthase
MSSDCITIPDLAIHLPSGFGSAYSAFNLPQSPACAITLSLRIDLHDGIIQGDDDTMLGLGVNYSTVNKQIYALVTSASTPATPRQWDGHEELMRQVAAIPLALEAVKGVQVGLTLDRASLYAKSVVYTLYFNAVEQGDREGAERVEGDGSSVECRDIDVICIIGLHPHERRDRQRLICDLKVEPDVPGLSTQGLVADAVEVCANLATFVCLA